MLISDKMSARLNEQINNEQYAAHIYLAMAGAFEKMGLKVFAQYYYKQSAEETEHAMKIFKYVVDTGAEVKLKAIGEPEAKWSDAEEIVKAALEHELKVTGQINEIVALAEEEKDYATRTFLNWFVDEQVEEVSSAQEMVDLVTMTPKTMILPLENRIYRMLE